jgi:hypothetical protein
VYFKAALQKFSIDVRVRKNTLSICSDVMYGMHILSADPCRQQGERVRGGLTSNKGRKEKIGQARFEACDTVLGPELTAGKRKV